MTHTYQGQIFLGLVSYCGLWAYGCVIFPLLFSFHINSPKSRNSYHKTQTTRPTQFSSKANTLCKANTVGESPLAPRKTSGQLKFLSILKCCLSWKYLECRRSQLKQIHDNKSIPFLWRNGTRVSDKLSLQRKVGPYLVAWEWSCLLCPRTSCEDVGLLNQDMY